MEGLQLVIPGWRPDTQPRPDASALRAQAVATLAAIDKAIGHTSSRCGLCMAPIPTTALKCDACGADYLADTRGPAPIHGDPGNYWRHPTQREEAHRRAEDAARGIEWSSPSGTKILSVR